MSEVSQYPANLASNKVFPVWTHCYYTGVQKTLDTIIQVQYLKCWIVASHPFLPVLAAVQVIHHVVGYICCRSMPLGHVQLVLQDILVFLCRNTFLIYFLFTQLLPKHCLLHQSLAENCICFCWTLWGNFKPFYSLSNSQWVVPHSL